MATSQVEDLARLSFKRQPLYVGIDDSKAASTREGLEQGYCCVASDKRFLLLFTFLKKNANKKVCTLSSRTHHFWPWCMHHRCDIHRDCCVCKREWPCLQCGLFCQHRR